jgi:excisionase family DNA binding protein
MATVETDMTPLMTYQQVAQVMQISVRTVWEMAKQGRLPAVRTGGRVRFRRETVLRFIESLESTGPSC